MYMNIRDFGAVGDAVHDDTAAIQAAVDAAAREGSTVFFPRGRYAVRTVRVPSHVTLLGHAAWGYVERIGVPGRTPDEEGAGNTVLIALDGEAEALLDLGSSCGTRIIGLGLDGADKGDRLCGISADGASEIFIEDVRTQKLRNTCIRLHNVDGFAVRKGLFIQCKCHALDVTGSRRGTVVDCQLSYNKGAGLYGIGAEDVIIIANRIEGGHPGGVYLEDSAGITVNGNSFDTAIGPPVTLIRCVGASVMGNMARLSGHDQEGFADSHIRLEDSSGVTAMGNAFWGWPALPTNPWVSRYGIVARNLKDSILLGNTFWDAVREAIIYREGGENVIEESNQGELLPDWKPRT